jgi:peptidoglycan/LPS O-acetylase OafA/YrhL
MIVLAVVAIVLLRIFSANPELAVWTSSLVHFQFFAIGSLLALRFSSRLPAYSAIFRIGLAVLGLVFLLISAGPLHINDSAISPVSCPLLALGYELMAAGILLIFLAFLGSADGKKKIPPALTYLGKISYGLYVFHDLALQICGAIANRYNIHMGFRSFGAAGLTLLLAAFSYRFFERPFLVLKDRFAFIQTRPA